MPGFGIQDYIIMPITGIVGICYNKGIIGFDNIG
jgi:hypothetical protein